MDDTKIKLNEDEQSMEIPYVDNMLVYKWFFDSFNQEKRKEIFETIFNYLFKKTNSEVIKDSPKQIKDYINSKDSRYYNKTFEEIVLSFKEKEIELNERLKIFKIRLMLKNKYSLILKDYDKNDFVEISCLRNIRFEDQYEWICSPLYLLYFQSYILHYKKPSRVQSIILKEEEEDKKVDTIDSVSKAEQILENENFIYIEDSGKQNIDYKAIFAEGNKAFIFSKNNVFEYLDYSINDPKQIKDSDIIYNNNYKKVLEFSFEPHLENLIYSFHNGYYFFEDNLINRLNTFIENKIQFFYINFNKINKIFNDKYKYKKYLSFWLAKLFPDQEKINNESKFCYFVKKLIDLTLKKKDNYLEIILNELNEAASKIKKIYENIDNTINYKRILIILNNINLSDLQFIEKKKFQNLNILFIINIQDNFDFFQKYFYDQTKLKKFFLENNNEIAFKDSNNENNNDYYYSTFISKDEYENSAKELIEKTFKDYKTNKDKLLNIAFILNTSEFTNRLNNKENSIIDLKINLGFVSELLILKPFCPLINFGVSNKDNINFYLDNIKFKEIFIYNKLKELYLSCMITYLNQNSTEFYLDDIKGPLLEKDIILSILTGQINMAKYDNYYNFQEVKVKSIFCLNKNELKNYKDNTGKNVVITQESKTAELYDFAIKINNNMKFGQISIFKGINDLEKLGKEPIILDLINFDLNKEKLNLGQVDNYSFAIITSINVYKEYSLLKEDNKIKHTFFLMKEHCKKNDLEFYIYNYFDNQMYIYNEVNDNIEQFNNFFDIGKKINFFDKGLQIYKFIEASNRKLSLKLTKKDLLKPFEKYYDSNGKKKISFINLAKYEFNISMLEMFSGINNIGLAFWNYSGNKEIEYLQINLNGKKNYFRVNNKINNKPDIFDKTHESVIHALLFLSSEEKIKEETKAEKDFLDKKRKKLGTNN